MTYFSYVLCLSTIGFNSMIIETIIVCMNLALENGISISIKHYCGLNKLCFRKL